MRSPPNTKIVKVILEHHGVHINEEGLSDPRAKLSPKSKKTVDQMAKEIEDAKKFGNDVMAQPVNELFGPPQSPIFKEGVRDRRAGRPHQQGYGGSYLSGYLSTTSNKPHDHILHANAQAEANQYGQSGTSTWVPEPDGSHDYNNVVNGNQTHDDYVRDLNRDRGTNFVNEVEDSLILRLLARARVPGHIKRDMRKANPDYKPTSDEWFERHGLDDDSEYWKNL